MNIANVVRRCPAVALWGMVWLCAAGLASGQQALDESRLQSLRARPALEIERISAEWAAAAISAQGRTESALSLARVMADTPSLVEHAALVRTFGKHLEPEFSQSVLKLITSAHNPEARGSLLLLLREAAPETAKSIVPFITDSRPAEDLTALSKKVPKLREALAYGAVAFRVCDVAFNVMNEIGATEAAPALQLSRSQSLESRDQRIQEVVGTQQETSGMDPIAASSDLSASLPLKQPVLHSAESKPPVFSASRALAVVVVVAAAGLLWLLLKRRK